MKLDLIHNFEKALVTALNLDGWRLVHTGETSLPYDAKGRSPRGMPCVIEMKFRDKYYETKILEVGKYNNLMKMDSDIQKFYFVNDPKGNFMYYLNTLEMPAPVKKYCPDTTMWTKKRLLKDVYLLKENQAVRININIEQN